MAQSKRSARFAKVDPVLDAATFVIFPTLMAFAAFSDLFTMTISNRVSILLVAAFVALGLAIGLPLETIGWHLLCGAGILCISFTLFAFGWIGGGDAKLAAATAVWLGWGHVLDYGFASSILGGVLTVGFIAARKWPLPKDLLAREWIARLYNNSNGVPYGIALAAAGVLVYPDTAVWLSAVVR